MNRFTLRFSLAALAATFAVTSLDLAPRGDGGATLSWQLPSAAAKKFTFRFMGCDVGVDASVSWGKIKVKWVGKSCLSGKVNSAVNAVKSKLRQAEKWGKQQYEKGKKWAASRLRDIERKWKEAQALARKKAAAAAAWAKKAARWAREKAKWAQEKATEWLRIASAAGGCVLKSPVRKGARRKSGKCNGDQRFCNLRFDQVTFAGTHNSNSSIRMGTIPSPVPIANHCGDIVEQLDAGIRGMMIDLHYWAPNGKGAQGGLANIWKLIKRGSKSSAIKEIARSTGQAGEASEKSKYPGAEVYACHGICLFGATKGIEIFTDIRKWLERNPEQVLMFNFESYVTGKDLLALLKKAGLDKYLYAHPEPRQPWPTLRKMIDTNKRIVVFVAQGGRSGTYDAKGKWKETRPGVSRAFHNPHFAWENYYDYQNLSAIRGDTCKSRKADEKARVAVLNHFITPQLPHLAAQANAKAELVAHAHRCAKKLGRNPTFLFVDFFEVGDVVAAARELTLETVRKAATSRPTVRRAPRPAHRPAPARRAASLRLSARQVRRGQPIAVRFVAGRGFSSDAWVGIVPSRIPHGSEAVNDRFDLSYQYLRGRSAGALTFRAPVIPGRYDFRMHDTNRNGREVAHAPFVVVP